TCRPRQEEADGGRPSPQRLTLAVADFLQRWLLHVPVPQTRVVRSYGLYHPTQADALAICRAHVGQPPVEAPVAGVMKKRVILLPGIDPVFVPLACEV